MAEQCKFFVQDFSRLLVPPPPSDHIASMRTVPSALLIDFFESSTSALNECRLVGEDLLEILTLSDLRKRVLQIQKTCLDQVISRFDGVHSEDVQHALRNKLPAAVSDKDMNEAARRAFCRLVLHHECYWEGRECDRHLIRSGKIERSDLLEFLGLCNTSVKLHETSTHLAGGAPLFGVEGTLALPRFASERMERIQRLLMTALGYEADFGTEEIKRIFFTPAVQNEFTGDEELEEQFVLLLNNMQVAITNAMLQESNLSDRDEGGFTKVLSVTYSEKVVSPDQINEGQSIGAPRQQETTSRGDLSQDLAMARDAATLQQAILGQLMLMNEDAREEALHEAKEVNDSFMKKVMEIPAGPERINFMRSIDTQTQQQLLRHKIWTGMLRAHNGEPPSIHYKK